MKECVWRSAHCSLLLAPCRVSQCIIEIAVFADISLVIAFAAIHAFTFSLISKLASDGDVPFADENKIQKKRETHKIQSLLKVLRRKYEFYAYALETTNK